MGTKHFVTGDGLVVLGWLLPALAYGDWAFRPDKEINMKSCFHENSIRTLEKLRDVYHSQLDTSVLAELDAVIADLKRVSDCKKGEVKLSTLSLRVLQVMSIVISLVSNLKDLMK